jgi:(p)ppGpp synthase/HD superfamily hydrolase
MMTGSGVPVEVQFLTHAERQEARTGEVAHIIYKYFRYLEKIGSELTAEQKRMMVEEAMTVLKSMHARKDHLNPHSLGVNERSLEGGARVEYALSA